MKLLFAESERPQDKFVINARTDGGDPMVCLGDTFEVDDDYGRQLLSWYHPRLTPVKTGGKAKRAAK